MSHSTLLWRFQWYAVVPGCFPTAYVYVHTYSTARELLFNSFGGVVSMAVHFSFRWLFIWRVFSRVLIKIVWFLVKSCGEEFLTQASQLKPEV